MNPKTLMLAASLICPVLLAAAASAAVPQQDPGPTVRWEVDSASENWLGTSVALGDHGAALIAGKELNTPSVAIYSTASPLPIHELELPDTWQVRVDAAREAQTMAAMVVHQDTAASGFVCWAELKVWKKARDAAPDWVYRFPLSTAYMTDGMDVIVSDDGERIVAWFTDPRSNGTEVHLRVFDRSGQLTLDKNINQQFGATLASDGQISQDGSKLLIDIANLPHLYDLETGQLLYAWANHSMFGGLALSGDGLTVAIGASNLVDVYRANALGNFDLAHSYPLLGNRIGGPIALDHDGSHMAYAILRYNPSESTQIRVRDLANEAELYRHTYEAPGNTVSLWPLQLKMTEDAGIVAGASSGDALDLTPTGFAYDRQGNVLAEIRTAGSALSMDMDPSGQVMAFGTKAAHINEFGSGGQIICADTRLPELSIAGFPESTGKLAMTIRGAATHARVVAALELGTSSTSWGLSQLDLDTVIANSGFLAIPATGLQRQLTLPSTLALIGQALHVQAELVDQAHQAGSLSNRVSIRVLP
jgi:hypothetical protein